jgi:hypothetical protein
MVTWLTIRPARSRLPVRFGTMGCGSARMDACRTRWCAAACSVAAIGGAQATLGCQLPADGSSLEPVSAIARLLSDKALPR